ncbi:MAG: nitrate reductase cytochrome c-type subunit [Helicobacteraceae bacterium]|jgi:cytochrome c-type protein NapB|nr:nitrate reductase cytochrome c-type subunit [Helicobacteraceae bacterium]
MKRSKLFWLLAIAGLVMAACTGDSVTPQTPEKAAVTTKANDVDVVEGSVSLKDVVYVNTEAGKSTPIARSFENAPPLIPHSMEGADQIDANMNMCLACHSPENTKMFQKAGEYKNMKSVPATHLGVIKDNDTSCRFDSKGYKVCGKARFVGGINKTDGINAQRYNCTACHVPQVMDKVEVKNNFSVVLRNQKTASQSDLIDKINDGL